MPRETKTYTLGGRVPKIGMVVLFHPPRVNEGTPHALPAIIHHVSDAAQGVVDLTVFCDRGPVVKRDVEMAGEWMEDRWTYRVETA